MWRWYDKDGTKVTQKGSNKQLKLPGNRILTAGQTYHWGVRVKTKQRNGICRLH